MPEKAPVPTMGELEEEKKSSVQLKRGPGTAVDEPKAKKGGVSSSREPTREVELKPASEVAKESAEGGAKAAERVKEPSKAKERDLGWF